MSAVAYLLSPLLFLLHAIPMNILLGGALIGGWSALSRGRAPARLAAWIGGLLPASIGWSALFGVLAIGLRDVAPDMTSLSVVPTEKGSLIVTGAFGGPQWPVPVYALFLIIAAPLALALRRARTRSVRASLSFVLAALCLFVGFLCSFTMNEAERVAQRVGTNVHSPSTWLRAGPSLVPRFTHIMLAAIAVTAMLIALHGLAQRRRDAEYAGWTISYGIRWFTIVTALQMVIGFWLLLAVPEAQRAPLMGGDALATTELVVGILLAVAVLIVMTHAADAENPVPPLIIGASTLFAVLVLMARIRETIQEAYPEAPRFRWPPLSDWIWSFSAEHAIFLIEMGLLAGAGAGMAWWIRRRLGDLPEAG